MNEEVKTPQQVFEVVKKWSNDRRDQINSDKGNLLLSDVAAARIKDCLDDITFLLNAVGTLAEILAKKEHD